VNEAEVEKGVRRMRIALSPPCVAPDCDRLGYMPLIAEEHGRLMGRDWIAGERIDTCGTHHVFARSAREDRSLADLLPEELADLSPDQPRPLWVRAATEEEWAA
jgi:hypothetical protein